MFNKRTLAVLFVALLVCDAMASAQLNAASNRKGKSMSLSGPGFRGSNSKHSAILSNPQILVRKSRKGSQKSGSKKGSYNAPAPSHHSAPKDSCAPAPSKHSASKDCASAGLTETIQGQKTIFNATWETIGECTRTWQQIKQVETCVDQINVKSACVDTITQQQINWQVLTQHKADQKVVRRVRAHINVLRPKQVQYQTLVAQHVEYQAIANQNVCVQTYAQKSACVGELANKKVNQRVMHEQKACARTLTAAHVNIKKVKKVNEQVSQLINTDSACLAYRNGASIHAKDTCVPAPQTCDAPKSWHSAPKSAPKKSHHSEAPAKSQAPAKSYHSAPKSVAPKSAAPKSAAPKSQAPKSKSQAKSYHSNH